MEEEDSQPLIVSRGRHSSKSQHNDEEEESEAVMESIAAGRVRKSFRFRLPVVLLGLFYFAVGVAVAMGSMESSFWLALGLSLGLLLPMYLSAPFCWSCLFRPLAKQSAWKITLYSVAFWAFLVGGAAGCSGGYFLREYRYSVTGVQANSVSPKTLVDAASVVSFTGATRPVVALGGRTVHLSVWPVCAAPLLDDPTSKDVKYFAVGNGVCCAGSEPSCSKWDASGKGGFLLRSNQLEFYPSLSTVVEQAVSKGMSVDPKHKFVIYGDVATMKSNDLFHGILTISASALFVLLVSIWKAVRTDFSL